MSAFTDRGVWSRYVGGDDYATTAPLSWEVGHIGSGLWVTVPVGFVFNFSTKWWYRWMFNPHNERYRAASALHDFALHVLGWDRVSAAGLFGSALKADEVAKWRRLYAVIGVIVWRWS